MNTMTINASTGCIIFFLMIAILFNLPYDFYTFLRLGVFGLSGYLFYMELSKKQKQRSRATLFITCSILLIYNPFAELKFHHTVWSFLDIFTAVFFFYSAQKSRSIQFMKVAYNLFNRDRIFSTLVVLSTTLFLFTPFFIKNNQNNSAYFHQRLSVTVSGSMERASDIVSPIKNILMWLLRAVNPGKMVPITQIPSNYRDTFSGYSMVSKSNLEFEKSYREDVYINKMLVNNRDNNWISGAGVIFGVIFGTLIWFIFYCTLPIIIIVKIKNKLLDSPNLLTIKSIILASFLLWNISCCIAVLS